MIMPLRFQALIDVPQVEAGPRQPVPAEFCGPPASRGRSEAYLRWLLEYAAEHRPAATSSHAQARRKLFRSRVPPLCPVPCDPS